MQYCQQIYECLCCMDRRKYPDPYNFTFSGFDARPENRINFESNYVKTSKYTWYSFLPKSLLLQFKRLANIYFLFIAILQSIPIISPLTPVTAWIPLTVVLTVSIIREGYEDYQRYKSDQEMNHQLKTHVRRDGKFVEVQWREVVVGDLCLVKQDQLFPVDMVLLGSSAEGGVGFIQTASLDGEKNLKPRNAHKSTIKYSDQKLLNNLTGTWVGRVPDKQLHKFSSNLIIDNETIVYEGDKQLLYRGSRLKNTKWVYGLAIYTGKNTKIMMNSQSSAQKMSQIQRKVNRILIFILIFQFLLNVTVAILYSTQSNKQPHRIPNIPRPNQPLLLDSILIFFSYVILINSMIPISLIVSMQVVKMSQSYFINKDNLMYSQYRGKGVGVKSASLNQELGQIQYVFSDKTGTLTMNLMEFKIAVVGNSMYGDLEIVTNPEHARNTDNNKGFRDQKLSSLIRDGHDDHKLQTPITIPGQKPLHLTTQSQLCAQYLLALSTAHEVIAQPTNEGTLKYQGPSPDQITLVEAARTMQYQFLRSTQSSTTIKIKGEVKTYELLQIFPFTSDRKRMSVVLRCEDGIKMYTKGADNVVKERLAAGSLLNLDGELMRFSRLGLRTLMVAMRTISTEEYKEFRKKVENLSQINRQKAYDELVSKLQSGLYLIGATAVLDRLQDFVPQTIRDLIRANIKVWMLTGDKMQTAQNIAKSCNLFQPQTTILKLTTQNKTQILKDLEQLATYSKQLTEKNRMKGLLIQGADLTPILVSQEGREMLVELAANCQAVVCCRLLPLQKAEVVNLVKEKLKKITLAIGDGANDVPMIKAAHIGIGLYGEQGMSAVQASDYALPEFRMLWRLLLVHGRWNYIRISEMILYFFFKNMLFTFPQFLLAFFCGFSGQSMYDDWYISFYNLIFTSVPLVVRAVLQQDINYIVKCPEQTLPTQQQSQGNLTITKPDPVITHQKKYLPSNYTINKYLYRLFPKIYFIGQQNCIFNYQNYLFWIVEAIVQAILITLFSIYILGGVSINGRGWSNSLWMVGLTMYLLFFFRYSSVICIVTFKICTHTKFISKLFLISVTFLSLFLYLAYMWISNSYFTNHIAGTTLVTWTTPKTYLTVLFCICTVLFIDGIVIHVDFMRGGYASKMRQIICENKEDIRKEYDNVSLKITEGVSQRGKRGRVRDTQEESGR